MCPFYTVEQTGVPGVRLVEADKPAQALHHVIEDTFTVKKVDGAELLAAAKQAEPEVAGKAKKADPAEPQSGEGEEPEQSETGEKSQFERMVEATNGVANEAE